MRWLPNISFSSNSAPSSASSSPKPLTADDPSSASFSPTGRQASARGAARNNILGRASTTPRLTRQRKLRHLTNQEVVGSAPSSSKYATDYAEPLALSRSASGCSPALPPFRQPSSVAVPLPLPLPLRENSNPGDGGDLRLPSTKDREGPRTDAAGDGGGVPPSISASPSMFVGRDKRRPLEHTQAKTSRVVRENMSSVDSSGDKFRINIPTINIPTRSAPTSPFASPIVSPQRKSVGAEFFPYHKMVAKGNQGWSAPEMATLDIPGLPPPAFFDFTAFSTDSSPLHSPRNRSPCHNPRSLNGAASPINAWREGPGSIEVHPLPLPPVAAAMVSPSQVVAKSESTTPMKSQWQKGKLIGRGTFGSVYVASNRETGALCAMKEVELFPDDPKSAECIKQLQQEIKVLSQLKHQNIVQYYGSEIVEDRFYIYLEYVHPGSINKYVREHCGAITESVVRSFTRHILSGLAYLHSMKTIHRDIKGANLLVDASGVVKLADFGMAKHLTGQAADLSLKGSPYWMAPELMQAVMQKDTSSDLALAVDIWSLGCTIIEMFTGKPPWSEYEGAAAMFKVMRDTPAIPETLSREGSDFLRCCFRRNPAERPSANMLLEHSWLKISHQPDVSPFTQSINSLKLTDIPHSPRASNIRHDQLPVLPSSHIMRGKVVSDRSACSSFMPYSFSPSRMASDVMMRLPT